MNSKEEEKANKQTSKFVIFLRLTDISKKSVTPEVIQLFSERDSKTSFRQCSNTPRLMKGLVIESDNLE